VKEVMLYTDGACSGNPGPGGFGVVLLYTEHRKELCGGYRRTTNNRMELLAVIRGLEALKGRCGVTLYSDSKYVLDALTKGWARRWRANGWRRNKKGEPAVNPDLWTRLLDLCDGHEMRYQWVKGHAGDPENERCDELSTKALARPDLPADELYERTERGPALSFFGAARQGQR
jgi:ribonuclease HI